jgi:hypothetical protein
MRTIRPNTTLRNRLPNRRNNETFELEVAGLHYTATISRLPDGRCCELLVNNHKSNSSADNTARDGAIIASIALQFGPISRQFGRV